MPELQLVFRFLLAAIAGLIFVAVANTLVTFNDSHLIFGLIGLAIFLGLAFSIYRSGRRVP